jgi:hypothetical protein
MTPKETKRMHMLEMKAMKATEDANYYKNQYERLHEKVVYEHQEWRALLRSLVTNAIGS